MNQPVTPAMTATIVPASIALTMNGNEKSWRTSSTRFQDSPRKIAASGMGVAIAVDKRGFRLADDDEPAVRRAQHLDRRAVETTEVGTRDHIVGGPLDRTTAGEVDNTVEVAEDRVDVVGDEQHCHLLLLTDPAHERRDRGLGRKVEAVERLVEQEELRSPDECLRDKQPLLLAAGEPPN